MCVIYLHAHFVHFLFFCCVCVCVCAIVFNQWPKTVPTRAASIWPFTLRVGSIYLRCLGSVGCWVFLLCLTPLVEWPFPFIDSGFKFESGKGSSLEPKGHWILPFPLPGALRLSRLPWLAAGLLRLLRLLRLIAAANFFPCRGPVIVFVWWVFLVLTSMVFYHRELVYT